ncbi:ABC transporter permease [Allokutzneria albata]|nr:ABC transporter permease [Allokutzneria albata]
MAVIEHARNHLALWLIALYLPFWLTAIYFILPGHRVGFVLRAAGDTVWAQGNELTQITGAINAVTQIVGFMMFTVTFRSGAFDRRLALAGFPRGHLVAAKTCVLVALSTVIACYTAALMTLFWDQRRTWLLALALLLAAMTYGAFGVLLATSVRGELEGMFLVLMISIVDVGLQNPIANHAAGNDLISMLPTYGAMQTASAAGFSSVVPYSHLALQLTWFAVLSALGLIVFHRNTRDRTALPAAYGNSRRKS